ncbi:MULTISPECIES: hypothetical protein [Vibrio]|uniref:hypothetical protein n=1 Tax=Vibrio TaxID=662 RepID=UPI0002E9B7E5|nr:MULTISPECIES: hypothetical protein [Vibrio]MDN3698929.1 hypothetical protein [Vibrio cortegadensis]
MMKIEPSYQIIQINSQKMVILQWITTSIGESIPTRRLYYFYLLNGSITPIY